MQECLGAFSTSCVESCTTLLKNSIQNYLLSHLGKVEQSPPLYLILTSLKKYLDKQMKASVLEPQPADCLVMGLEGGMRKGEGKGWQEKPSLAFLSAAEMWE